MKRVWLSLLLVVLCAGMFMAQDTVKIGVVYSMTGGVSAFGRMTWDGVQIANELFPEVLGKKIELVLIDDKSDKVEAANGVRRAIEQEGVVAILGNITSGNTLAGSAVAEELKIPMVSSSATNPLVTQDKEYMNRVCFSDPFQGWAGAKLATELGYGSVAVFVDVEQDYAVALANYFEDTYEQDGGNMFYEYYKSGDQDFTAQVLDAMSKGAEAFYIPGYYQEIALIAMQARQNGFYGDFITGDGADAPETVEIGGDAVEGLFFTGHYHPDSPAFTEYAKMYVDAYEKKFDGQKSPSFAGLGFDAYMVLRDAIQRAGSMDSQKIKQALRETKKFPGATGYININENGDAVKSVTIVRVEGGNFEYDSIINP